MIYTINKGKHRAWPLPIGLYWNKTSMIRKVILGFDAIYKHNDPEDQADVNKLFGIGYVNGGHMTDSARWGWRYNSETKMYEYCSYCHVSKKVFFEPVCTLNAVNNPTLRILIEPGQYIFIAYDGFTRNKIIGEVIQRHDHTKKLQYKLGPYFGGNNTALQTIKIELKKL